MKATISSSFTVANAADEVAGVYKGFAKYLEGGNNLGREADTWTNYLKVAEATVQVARISNCELHIRIHFPGLPDFEFKNNVLYEEVAASKYLIDGDWITEWGIIGWADTINRKIHIDINPVHYTQTPNSKINPEHLLSRYVINSETHPGNYKTVFNLEFEGYRTI